MKWSERIYIYLRINIWEPIGYKRVWAISENFNYDQSGGGGGC